MFVSGAVFLRLWLSNLPISMTAHIDRVASVSSCLVLLKTQRLPFLTRVVCFTEVAVDPTTAALTADLVDACGTLRPLVLGMVGRRAEPASIGSIGDRCCRSPNSAAQG